MSGQPFTPFPLPDGLDAEDGAGMCVDGVCHLPADGIDAPEDAVAPRSTTPPSSADSWADLARS